MVSNINFVIGKVVNRMINGFGWYFAGGWGCGPEKVGPATLQGAEISWWHTCLTTFPEGLLFTTHCSRPGAYQCTPDPFALGCPCLSFSGPVSPSQPQGGQPQRAGTKATAAPKQRLHQQLMPGWTAVAGNINNSYGGEPPF